MSVSQIYQHHLKDLSFQEKLALIRLLVETTLPMSSAETPKQLHSVMEFSGKGIADARPGDAQDAIDKLRDEWD